MLALNIISTFIIGFMSFIGIQIPNFIGKNNDYLNNLKIFSCGIIISTGFIHMINEGQLELYELDIDYPIANLITGLTIISIITLENLLFYLIKLNWYDNLNNDNSNDDNSNDDNSNDDNLNNNNLNDDNSNDPIQKLNTIIHKPTDAVYRYHVHESIIDRELCEINICNNNYINKSNTVISYKNSVILNDIDLHIKKYVILHLLELGIAIHSVIIGISLGLLDNVMEQIILLIVISLHQLFEGISIGNGLLDLYKLPRYHYIFMILIFILTTPIGVCIGILMSKEYSDNLLVTGILNCISGGLLIYTGINNLINITNKTLVMHGLLFLGFACMAILGIWS
jgi:zinc transporter 1/2/3